MAEDPGVGTMSAIIEAIRQAFGFVQDVGKSLLNTAADITRTYMYMSWRKNARGSGQSFKHGEQSLKSLRAQEAAGAKIVTVEIGKDDDSMSALEWELRKLDVDFAITRAGDGEWLLHYKQSNEQDVLRAQAYALNARYGDPERETATRDPLQQDAAWVDLDSQNALRAKQQELAQDNREGGEQARSETKERQSDQQTQDIPKAVPPTVAYAKAASALLNQGQTEQAAPLGTAKTERATTQDAPTRNAGATPSKETRVKPSASRPRTAPAPSVYESLDSLKSKARIQAAEKNRARSKDKGKNRSRNRNLERKARTRSRSLEPSR